MVMINFQSQPSDCFSSDRSLESGSVIVGADMADLVVFVLIVSFPFFFFSCVLWGIMRKVKMMDDDEENPRRQRRGELKTVQKFSFAFHVIKRH
jgi:hypothetical protein